MPYRSDQAVASQDQASPPEPPSPRRFVVGWATALAALGASTLLVGFGVWAARFALAEFFIGAALSERGAEADFDVVKLDFEGVSLADVRVGSQSNPDVAAERIDAAWVWRGLTPRLTLIHIREPTLRLSLNDQGQVSAGALERLRGGGGARRRPSIPQLQLEIDDGRLLLDAPFGRLEAPFDGGGTLGEDFEARAELEPTSLAQNGYAIESAAGQAELTAGADGPALALNLGAERLVWADAETSDAAVHVVARAPLDLASMHIETAWRVRAVEAPSANVRALAGTARAEANMRADGLEPALWDGEIHLAAARLAYGDMALQNARWDAHAEGEENHGQGRWTLSGAQFDGFALSSPAPSGYGDVRFDFSGAARMHGEARLRLRQARLDDAAQQRIRASFPDLGGAPVAPTFASAERALDAAADRFDIDAPISFDQTEDGFRIVLRAPLEARAATGARLRLTPLRQDTPTLVAQWPGALINGAVSIELQGGGGPSVGLLLDRVHWAPSQPFEADGTLSLSDWRASGASIAASELGVDMLVSPEGVGRIGLRGPARITGPVGDGEVRDLVADLNLAVDWSEGWRVSPADACLPVRFAGLEVAGLAFSDGAFAVCAQGGALIASDANERLSGGFVIRELGLAGRMAGPDGAPVRLGAGNVAGRFGGRQGDMVLAMEAAAPRLRIDMAAERTLVLQGASVTANASIAESWGIEGAFTEGTFEDPAMPGTLAAIAGRWRAAPEGGAPVIRVLAAEALMTATRPATDAERPLFNPLRLTDFEAVLRDGDINARGDILLEAGRRRLASFTAAHDVSEGAGQANVAATALEFGNTLQPYDITERMRGLVDNVSGDVDVTANVSWTRTDLLATGSVRFNGISLATATIPVVAGLRGEVWFDDLFMLTTPPGQYVTLARVNPGVAVENGRVRFQLLSEQRVAIESAAFDFAAGTLEMTPTVVTLGAEETELVLTLRDVDASTLLANLNVPDLAATGTVEGAFPLRLTRTAAYVEGGVLRAQPGGGLISYTGDAGDAATGPARIAFDALRSFQYSDLSITLDGDLSGEVVSAINFEGVNSARPVDLGPIAPTPVLGNVSVRGVPFKFNVNVTAPFRRLAQTAASIYDPTELLNRAESEEGEIVADPDDPVDQETQENQ